jgi:AcrR family transcriptional regulator
LARPTTISDEQILDAARAVFLEQGSVATTAEVARRAGVAEGSIFKRFKTKSDLFAAAMKSEFLRAEGPEWFVTLRDAGADDDWRDVLFRAGTQAVEFFRRLLPLMMMRWSSGTVPEELLQPNSPPLRALKLLSSFFERQMRAGNMRRHDPEIVARMFVGSIQSFVFLEILTRLRDEMPMPVESYLRGVIQLIASGVAAEPKPRSPRTKKPRER